MRKLFIIAIILIFVLLLPWGIISSLTDQRVFRDVDTIPVQRIGLVLGTTPSVGGYNNLFFSTRIEAAKTLYERGKIEHILVSGDNSTDDYNEPEMMRKALLKAGIPEEDITLDYAGFRTLDSVVRAKEIFCQDSGFTIISQPFHVERALFLASQNDIDAIGFGTVNVSLEIGMNTYIREIAARWKALFDIFFGTDPGVLGPRECIKVE